MAFCTRCSQESPAVLLVQLSHKVIADHFHFCSINQAGGESNRGHHTVIIRVFCQTRNRIHVYSIGLGVNKSHNCTNDLPDFSWVVLCSTLGISLPLKKV